jgi:hypothetical protein
MVTLSSSTSYSWIELGFIHIKLQGNKSCSQNVFNILIRDLLF